MHPIPVGRYASNDNPANLSLDDPSCHLDQNMAAFLVMDEW